MIVVVVTVSLDGGVLDRAIHWLDLANSPKVIWLGHPVLNPTWLADQIEPHRPRVCCVPVAGLFAELDAVVSKDRMDSIEDSVAQTFKEFPLCVAVRIFHDLGGCKLAGLVHAKK